jgi:hypothetical protein
MAGARLTALNKPPKLALYCSDHPEEDENTDLDQDCGY